MKTKKNPPITIGSPPFSREDFVEALGEFAELYKKRPVQDNDGGMKAPQMFYAWYTAKRLQPTAIIESGVWKGQGTWFFEQACPNAAIVCLDPYPQLMQYKSKFALYANADFSNISWSDWHSEHKLDPQNTLCFFDDHQNALERLRVATPLGFRHLMFEDNYPVSQGDCVSLKTILEEDLHSGMDARSYLRTYYEFPPPVKGDKTRWGDDWTDEHYPTHDPLITEYSKEYEDYFDGHENYTWICYAEIEQK